MLNKKNTQNKPRKFPYYWDKEQCRLEALKYSHRSDFAKNSNGAYSSALKKGWLNEICSHMIVKWQPKWNKETCIQEALKYHTKTDFQTGSVGAWTAANKKGWLNEICSHMEVKWRPKWDKESCIKEALKYQSRKNFQRGASGAWSAANKKGWLDEICSHMEVFGNFFHRCIYAFEFSDNYVYVGLTDNFRRRKEQHLNNSKSPVCHHMQKTNLKPIYKILHEYTDKILARQLEQSFLNDYINKGWNILNKAKTGSLGGQKLYWTKERCIEKAKEYLTRNKFSKECSGAYASSIKNNWLDEVCLHMVSLIASPRDWNLKILQEEAIKYNTRKEFFNKSNTAYEYARKKKWLDLICSHMIHPTPLKKWTLQALKEEALKYKTRREFGLKNSSAYSIASKEGFIAVVCSHMELQHKTANHWTKEKCQERAFLYQTKMEFKRKDGSAYTTAVREKWITEICSHMVKPEPKRKWTVEALFIEAQKYNSIKSFKAKSQSAYVTAGRLGVLKQVCMHMSMNMKNETKQSE